MNNEIELKLEVAPEATEGLMLLPWLGGGKGRPQRQLSVYFDTPDRELRRRGYTLRVRSASDRLIQTVKSLSSSAALFDRGEWECEIDRPEPDLARLAGTPLGALELRVLGELQPIIRSDVNRTAFRLNPAGAEIELDVDHGMMTAAGNELPVSEIEIELVSGRPESAVALARRIAAEVPVKLGVMSKAERGFALAEGALSKPTKSEPVPVNAGMTVAQGFETIVIACLRHFRLNEPLVIERRNMEALHQSRVAMRRLRSAFTLFRPAIGDEECERIRAELRWFTGQLGDARNLDVYLQRDLDPDERPPIVQKREAAYDTVIDAMDSQPFRRLTLDLVAWSALGEWRRHPKASQPLTPFVNRRIDRLWARISRSADPAELRDQERHQLRVQTKKLRYALEFVAAIHVHKRGKQKKFAKTVEELQETLGLLNDFVVARSLISLGVWPIAPQIPKKKERGYLHKAQRAFDRLRKIGPYWRASAG
jgi:triphosphatase